MTSINDFISLDKIQQRYRETYNPQVSQRNIQHANKLSEPSNDEKKISLSAIVNEKPPVKELREFMKNELDNIKSKEEELFESD